ncbi:MAG: hypothetical protein M3495_14580, partial [Pseudomonadota bacterium]|nr:hypothetical protein [Pseudomonadota bacterium]
FIQHRHKRSVLRLDLLYRGRNLHPALKHISHTLLSYFCAMPKAGHTQIPRVSRRGEWGVQTAPFPCGY